MKDKKHIDKLFKDRFKDFEVSPSPEVWSSIQASLEERKKDCKLIPLWWKVGGVAALLALLFTVGNSVFNSPNSDSPIVINQETLPSSENDSEQNPLLKDNVIIVDINTEENNSKTIQEEKENSSNQRTTHNPISKEAIYNSHKSSKNSKVADVNNSKKTTNSNINSFFKDKITLSHTEKEAVAIASEKQTQSGKDNPAIDAEKNNSSLIKKEIIIAETSKTEVTTSAKDTDKSEEQSTNTEIAKTEENKQSILDAINEQNIIKTEDAVAKESALENRWDVAPNFAPVYYSTLSSGSSIDPAFSDNSQSGDINFSYGIQISYAVNKRLSVRSGINNVDLSYATSGIELGTGPVSSALKSIDYGAKQNVLTAFDKGSLDTESSANGGFENITPKSTNGAAEIIQSITYYEIPLELKYALLNKKMGVNVIGGLSTLFLGSNGVSVKAGGFESTLGESNNLSSVSFSTNIGLGFDYKISRKFKFNIEPMFKYQLNPYTDSSVDFKPYYLGVYTGFSYKF